MKPATDAAYRAWRRLVEKGYGDHVHPADMAKVDARIRKAKEKYERLLADEK